MSIVALMSILDLPQGFKIPKPGIPTGLRDLDFQTGGLKPGLVVVLARPGIEATSFLLALALHAVRSTPVTWVGHLTASELALQATCALFDVDRTRIDQGLYPPWRLEGHYRCLGRWLIHPFKLCSKSKDLDLRSLVKDSGSGLFVLDLTVEELEQIGAWTLELKEMVQSKEMTIVIRINDGTLPLKTDDPWPQLDEMAPVSYMEHLEVPASLRNLLEHADLEMDLLPVLDPNTDQPQIGKYFLNVMEPRGCKFLCSMERDPDSGVWQDISGNVFPSAGGIGWNAAD